jgi:hypothetical protein
MAARNLRTANYPEDRRRELGNAVGSARRAAGFKWRTDFSRAHADVSVSSLKAIEQAKPLVGVTVLEAIGRALGQHFPGRWTEDTPRLILEGAAAPELTPAPPEVDIVEDDPTEYKTPDPRPQVGTREWLIHYARLLRPKDFVEVRLVLLRMMKAEAEVLELEAKVAELTASLTRVRNAPVSPN